MKKTFTLLQLLFVLTFPLFLLPNAARAQGDVGVCEFADDCLFIAFEAIQEESPSSPSLLIVLTAFLQEGGRCNIIDGLILSPAGGFPTLITREDLEENQNFIELVVDRDTFTETPDILVATFRYFTIPVFGVQIPIPIDIVDLQARLDSDDPCLPITPLPVELASFEGKVTQSGISLEWETASEQNNSHFEVERSADGKTFAALGSVPGNGNSSVSLAYSYLDKYPLEGMNYYRLKQVDVDGRYEYSKVVAVTAAEKSGKLQAQLLPNPCLQGDCQLRIATAAPGQPVRVQLQDLTGRVVFEQNLRDDGEQLQLSPQQLQNLRGVFILSAEAGQEVVRQRVVLE
ncbi:hypothetical protein [Pontibacter flavimaris]|uniref:T9SS C-terminal target domain-containing protein n=1 Tax=Pontibacter flavimaris TaxID=1797110 RepID=A0A1Q5PG35_9BACT|nr:hypothetical protein [Pontibacter flavimaris]OKL41205.1 hypothetical protein A3841_15415 [Pontibacter flavimaris]